MKRFFLLLSFIFFFGTLAYSQPFFRITGDFSIKSKNDSIGSLTVGSFFFDKNESKLIYKMRFPKEQLWVFADTAIYRFQGDSLLDQTRGAAVAEFSIFNLVLNNDLTNYGLESSIYSLEEVEKDEGLVIATWVPPAVLDGVFGKVMISTRGKLMNGIVFFDADDEIKRKQLFKKYENFDGLLFPTEIIDIFYQNEQKIYQQTTYRNLRINETSNDALYKFELPAQPKGSN
jgi:hypothetical protein